MSKTTQSSQLGNGRHNMYYAIHKGLRLGHCRLLTTLGTNDFTRSEETEKLLSELRGFLRLGQRHLESEESEIHAEIEKRAPGTTAHTHADHSEHEHSFEELEALICVIEDLPAAKRVVAGDSLYRRYALFAAADFQHMHSEETELLKVMQELFNDEELHMIEGRIVAKIPPEAMIAFLRLIMPALNAPERLDMLRNMKGGLPSEIFAAILTDAVRPVVDAKSYAEIEAGLRTRRAA